MTTDRITARTDGALDVLTRVVKDIAEAQLGTYEHSRNVASYAVRVAERLGLAADRVVRLARAATFHDVGKAAVPEAILVKPGPLSDEEYRTVQEHPVVGEAMLEAAGLPDEAAWVRAHHERFDGRGYPDGLEGEGIPIESRIIFVTDAFEVMTSDRPYRLGIAATEAVAELERCAGTQFDPVVVEALVDLVLGGELPLRALRRPIT